MSRSMRLVRVLRLLPALGVVACGSNESDEATATSTQPIIFGQDNRVEPYTVPAGSLEARIAASSIALIDSSHLEVTDSTRVRVIGSSQVQRFNVCPDERFANQLSAADCSGTLITPDLVLTAGHCVDSASCAGTLRLVRGYAMSSETSLAQLAIDDVYRCSRVVARRFDADSDFAVLRLDRPVTKAEIPRVKIGPLPLVVGQSLVLAGYPEGLPQKVTNGASVFDARGKAADYFLADIDSFPGNSGSGVFLGTSGVLAGILVRGPNPGYVLSPGEHCTRPERATAAGSTLIASTYVHHAIAALCAAEPDPALCACGNGVCEPERDESTSTCPSDCGSQCHDGACNGAETADSCYGDCGACGDTACSLEEIARMNCPVDCGCPPGLFEVAGACVPTRGNTNGDDKIDWRDAAALRMALWDPKSSLHLRAADVDCSGQVDPADLRALDAFVSGTTRHLPCDAATSIATGFQFTCALTASGRVRCWGDNARGQLGYGTTVALGSSSLAAKMPALELGGTAKQISAGAAHACALLTNGSVVCWGDGNEGQLGYGDTHNVGDIASPVSKGAVSLGGRATFVATGGSHSCAILEDGTVRCWGSNTFGQLGYGSPARIGDDELPSSAEPLRFPEAVSTLALGFDHTCALTVGKELYCWGENFLGQLGRGTLDAGGPFERADETQPLALGGPIEHVAAGVFTTCAVRHDGAAYCWGDNSVGQLGNGNSDTIGDDESPVEAGLVLGGTGVAQFALGLGETCARYSSGAVKCWGDNSSGWLGYGNSSILPTTPAALGAVAIGAAAESIALSSNHVCVVVSGGSVLCWGDGASGKLGYGSDDTIGADSSPQSAGSVPLGSVSTPGWKYENPLNLQLWMHQTDENGPASAGTTSVTILLLDPSATALHELHAFYNFATPLGTSAPLISAATASPGWRISLEPSANGFFSAVISPLEDTTALDEDALRSTVMVAKFRLGSGDSVPLWGWQDDYSAADRPIRDIPFATRRIQVVDAQGNVLAGWTPR